MPVAHERGELAQEAVVSVNRDDAVLAADTLNDHDHARVDDEEFLGTSPAAKRTSPGRPRAGSRAPPDAGVGRRQAGGRRRRGRRFPEGLPLASA